MGIERIKESWIQGFLQKKKKKEERERDFNAMLVLNNEMSVIKIDFYIFLQSPLKTATGCSLDLF